MRNIILAVFLSFFLLLFTSQSIAQEPPPLSSSTEAYLRDQYEFLKHQSTSFDERVQRERDSFMVLTQTVFGVIALLLTAVSVIGVTSYWGTLKSIEATAGKKLGEKLDTEMASFNTKIDNWAQETMFSSLGLSKKILFIAREQDHASLTRREIRLLKERGFSNIDLSTEYQESEDLGMVIFCYNADSNEVLTDTVGKVVESGKEIPILGYSSQQIVNEALGRYDWKSYANSPLTLVSWTFIILSSSKKNV